MFEALDRKSSINVSRTRTAGSFSNATHVHEHVSALLPELACGECTNQIWCQSLFLFDECFPQDVPTFHVKRNTAVHNVLALSLREFLAGRNWCHTLPDMSLLVSVRLFVQDRFASFLLAVLCPIGTQVFFFKSGKISIPFFVRRNEIVTK